jgi:Cu-processing system permease protein
MRPRTIVLVAGRELREASRSRWLLLAGASFFLLSLALSWVGLAGSGRAGMAGFDRTAASLLNLTLLFVPLVTLTLGALSVAGDLEDGALGLLLAQPVTRAEVLVGKYLGLLGAMSCAILAGFGASGIAVGAAGGGGDARIFAALVGVAVLLAAATLAIGIALSAALRSRARAIGAAFTVWLILVYVSDLGMIGLTAMRGLSAGQVFALALMNPVQQARVLGTLAVAGRPDFLGPVGLFGLDTFGAAALVALLAGALVATAVVAVGLGFSLFRRTVVP